MLANLHEQKSLKDSSNEVCAKFRKMGRSWPKNVVGRVFSLKKGK